MVASNAAPFSGAMQNLDGDFGYGQLFEVLLRRKHWVLAPLVGAIALAGFYTYQQKPQYISSMQLLVEQNYQSSKNDLEGEFADSGVRVDIATQFSLMQSSDLLRRAMGALQAEYPDEFNPQDPQDFVAFRNVLQLSQVGEGAQGVGSKIFEVRYVADDGQKAQKVLQAVQKVYLDYNLEQQQARLEKGLSFINAQLPEVRANVDASEAALESFRQGQGMVDPEQQALAQVAALNSLDQELRSGEAELQQLSRRYSSLLQQVGMAPDQALLASRLSQSSRYQALLNQIQETELSLVAQRLRYQDVTPQVDQLNQQRQQQLQLLSLELGRVLNISFQTANSEALLFQGQMGGSELSLVNDLVSSKIDLDMATARQQSLLRARQGVQAELSRFPSLLAEYGRLLPEINSNRETLQLLLKAQQELGLEIARGGFDWQVVEQPLWGNAQPIDWKKNLLLGGVAGLMVGGMAAFAREALDDMVHTSEELQKQVPVPLVGMVPALHISGSEFGRLSRQDIGGEQVLAPAMQSLLRWPGFRESMDLVYQNMQLVNTAAALRSVVVTSALAGEGKSTLALGLAFSAARLHQRVLLIDGDLRRPSLHKLMNLPNSEGLSTYLSEHGAFPKQLLSADTGDSRTGISVLTAGPIPADPAKLLSSPRLGQLIAQLGSTYDLIVVDAPPSMGMVDSMLLSDHCDGTLLVGRMDRLSKTELSQALDNLRHINVVGVVANGVSSVRKPYSYVGVSYG